MTQKFCPRDQRNVETEHSWNTVVLVLLLIFLTLIGIIYLAIKWKRRCPICQLPEDQMLPPNTAPMPAMVGYVAAGAMQGAMGMPPMPVATAQVAASNCPTCGNPLTWVPQYNRWFCAKEQQYK